MKEAPLVSVVIPCFNSERTIKSTVNSVLGQTYNNYEIIIVDDASTDKTQEICSKFVAENDKIKYFRLENNSGGPSIPSNFGVEKSSGNYVAFLDHDDVWLPLKLEKQIPLLVDNRIDMVSCYVLSVHNDKEQILKIVYKPQDYLAKILQKNFLPTLSTIVIKKDVFKKIGGFDVFLKGPQDWDLYIRFFSKGFCFDYVKEILAKRINLDTNLSSTITFDKYEKDRLYIYNKYKKLYKKNDKIYSDYLRSVAVQYLSQNKKNEAIKALIESIKINPLNLYSYLYLPIISSAPLFRFLLRGKIKIINAVKR